MSEFTVLSKLSASRFIEKWHGFATESHFWMQWRLAVFSRLLRDLGVPTRAPWKGLDIGCGAGVVCRQVERASLWTVDGADLDDQALARHPPRKGKSFLYDINDRVPEMGDRYDFILLFDVIEHIRDTERFIDSALYHLRPGGWLFVNVPAFNFLLGPYDRAAGHLRRYDSRSIAEELGRHPLETREIRYWGASLIPLLVLRSLATSGDIPAEEVIQKGFQPPNEFASGFLKGLMRLETSVAARPFAGTSVMAAAVKK